MRGDGDEALRAAIHPPAMVGGHEQVAWAWAIRGSAAHRDCFADPPPGGVGLGPSDLDDDEDLVVRAPPGRRRRTASTCPPGLRSMRQVECGREPARGMHESMP